MKQVAVVLHISSGFNNRCDRCVECEQWRGCLFKSLAVIWKHVQIKKAFNYKRDPSGEKKLIKHPWLLGGAFQDGSPIRAKRSTCSMQMSPCVRRATPTNPPKNKQQLHILFKSRAAGHPHQHNITERAPAPCTGLSSMMYVADRYLPHQRLRLFWYFY